MKQWPSSGDLCIVYLDQNVSLSRSRCMLVLLISVLILPIELALLRIALHRLVLLLAVLALIAWHPEFTSGGTSENSHGNGMM